VWTPAGRARASGTGYEPTGDIEADPGALEAVRALALAATRCSTGRAVRRRGAWTADGDPMEAALHVLALRAGVDVCADEAERPTRRRFSFDPRRRRMSVEVGDRLIVKGAPDALLDRCEDPGDAARAVDELAARGLRVLAIASRDAREVPAAATADEAENHLDLLGLVALEDPPRPGAAEAIAACRRAGIRVAMITGDHAATARAIAAEVGLLGSELCVVEGRELPGDDAALGASLDRDGVVVCRVSPEDKLRIVKALQARGHVVAMTGDGVNDGPVLQQADIGVAMGMSGTDVAREAADLVLLDDDFATIVAAVEQGRATFFNVRRVLTYHLTDNVAELAPFVAWALSAGRFPLALGVLQILCLDLITDQLPALALGAERPDARALARPPPRIHLVDAHVLGRVFGVLGPAEALMELLAFAAVLAAAGFRFGGASPDVELLRRASGAAFAAVVVGQAANAFACRSTTRAPGALGWTSNRFLLAAVGFAVAVLVLLLSAPRLAQIVGHAMPPPLGLAAALLTAPAVLLADALHKRWRGSRRRPSVELNARSNAPAP
jgi:magnesium-transporting ATPase (P-type)